jgi:shikimate dehydrogenase
MLVAQAKESVEWFTGAGISDEVIPQIEAKLMREMENIILIGMPGSGKTTVGKLLAEQTGRVFVDTDAVIVERAGCSIPEFFRAKGEAAFRALETQVLSDICKESGLIIATGGGCVTREENYPLLHQNGTLIRIHRPLEALSIEGRPLSQTMKLTEMLRIRDPLYTRFADFRVENTAAPEIAAAEILRIWEERP